MPGSLTHSPADIVRRLLIALGVGVDPPSSPWPIYASGEPSLPDNVITVFGTTGRQHGRTATDGEMQEHHGIQVRIRAATYPVGYTKARTIATALDTMYQDVITVPSTTNSYLIHAILRTSDVIELGKETPSSKREIFTVNALVSVRAV